MCMSEYCLRWYGSCTSGEDGGGGGVSLGGWGERWDGRDKCE